ncbi:hypothetical protein [Pseudomonas canadensis]|uniref:hypothetical protein n=1 Tax=Pseudomonas canadensis TaxID=915099 RepID=UPI000F47FCAC|nr:hypothetical protein [Pseudomonas canadensis]
MRILKWLIVLISATMLLCIVIAYSLIDRSDAKVPTLKNHPNAHWSGAQDGGVFFEITKKAPPDYYVQVRYESGDIWSEGWVRYESKKGVELATQDLLGYDGGEDVYLQDGTALKLEPKSRK